MTNEVAKIKIIMEVALRVHQKQVQYYKERLLEIFDIGDEKLYESYERKLIKEKARLKEVEDLMHEMEADGLWE